MLQIPGDEICARRRRDSVSEPIANGYQLIKQASFVAGWHGVSGLDRVRSGTSRIAAYVPLSNAMRRTALRSNRKGPPGGEPFLNLHEVVLAATSGIRRKFVESDQAALIFVPQFQPCALDAVAQCETVDRLQLGACR